MSLLNEFADLNIREKHAFERFFDDENELIETLVDFKRFRIMFLEKANIEVSEEDLNLHENIELKNMFGDLNRSQWKHLRLFFNRQVTNRFLDLNVMAGILNCLADDCQAPLTPEQGFNSYLFYLFLLLTKRSKLQKNLQPREMQKSEVEKELDLLIKKKQELRDGIKIWLHKIVPKKGFN